MGGTIGWRVGTDSHELRRVRATGASQVGILVVGNRNSISYNSVRSCAVGIEIDGDFNDLRGGTVENNTSDGVQLGSTANNNTFRTANVQTNRGRGMAARNQDCSHNSTNTYSPRTGNANEQRRG